MPKTSPYLIRFDWAIKRLLRQKASFAILEGFLSELLRDDITIQEILESDTNQNSPDDKFNRVDILAKTNKGEPIIIEVQNSKEVDYFQRMLYATSKTASEHLHISNRYAFIKKIYSVNIVYFELGQGDDYVYHGKTRFTGIHNGDTLKLSEAQKNTFAKDEVYNIFPEYYVIKVDKFDDVAKDGLDEWIYYLKNDKVLEGSKGKGLQLVAEQLRVEALATNEQFAYRQYMEGNRIAASILFTAKLDGMTEGLAQGLQQGEVFGEAKGEIKGQKKQALYTACKLKALGMDAQTIADCTGLTVTEVEALDCNNL